MIKDHDIFILIDTFTSGKMSLVQQKERMEKYYQNNSSSILVKSFVVRRSTFTTVDRDVRMMMRTIANHRLVICNQNLIGNKKIMLKLFNDAKSIFSIYGKITRQWIKERLAAKARMKPTPYRPYIRKERKLMLDEFGLPVIHRKEYGLLDVKEAAKAIKREKLRRKQNLFLKKEYENRKTLLEKKNDKYRDEKYKEVYDILVWHTPIDRLLTNQKSYDKAVMFLKKVKSIHIRFKAENIIVKTLVYNTDTIPKKSLPIFKKIVASDKDYLYGRKTKRNNK